MTSLITKHTLEEHTNSLASYLPGGKLFNAARISGTNFRNFLVGLSNELALVEETNKLVADEYDVRTTTLFISEWESAFGIQDSCFNNTGTIEERRRNVLVKMASLGVQTAQDFIDIGAMFGVTLVVKSGSVLTPGFPFTFTFNLVDDANVDSRFTIVVEYSIANATNQFPLTFPVVFGTDTIRIIECLFSKLKPANCILQFNQV